MKSSEWQDAPIRIFASPVRRLVKVDPSREYRTMGVRWWGMGAYERETKPGHEIKAGKMFAVKPGDLVINRIWVRHGSSAIVGKELEGCVVTTDFPIFEIDQNQVYDQWLSYMFKSRWFWSECDSLSRGTSGRQRINPEDYLSINIPLPPMDVQRRIVRRIDALAGRIGEAVGLQRDARKEVEALLDASLYSIFSPEATRNWKDNHLGDLSAIVSGVTLGRKIHGTTITVPYLRVANVQDGRLDLSEIKFVNIRPFELEKWRLQPGDLVLTEGGDMDKLGRGTIWKGEIPDCIHQNHIFRVRLNQDFISPEFLELEIRSPYGKDYFLAKAKKTTNLASINQTQLRAFLVRYPDTDTQQKIVYEVQKLSQRINRLKEEQSNAELELDALFPAVLERAFRGEL